MRNRGEVQYADRERMGEEGEETMTVQEAAKLAGVARSAIYRAIDNGKIVLVEPGVKGFGKGGRVSRESVDRFAVERRRVLQDRLDRVKGAGAS